MVTLHMEFAAHALKRNISVKALVPVESEIDWSNSRVDSQLRFKTLYLLHGFGGDCSDWLRNSGICRYAQEHKIAVIMPSGENSFYLDNPNSEEAYSGFITKELIEITRALLPLSDRREDTILGGLSMGGYGALYNGLQNPEIFGTVFAFSSALITDKVAGMKEDYKDPMAGYPYYEYIFGRPEHVLDSTKNLRFLVKDRALQKKPFPHIYLACGTEDFLLDENRKFVECLKENHVAFTYEEDTGSHDWDFWDRYIRKALKWYDEICGEME